MTELQQSIKLVLLYWIIGLLPCMGNVEGTEIVIDDGILFSFSNMEGAALLIGVSQGPGIYVYGDYEITQKLTDLDISSLIGLGYEICSEHAGTYVEEIVNVQMYLSVRKNGESKNIFIRQEKLHETVETEAIFLLLKQIDKLIERTDVSVENLVLELLGRIQESPSNSKGSAKDTK